MSEFFIHDFQKDIWNDNYRFKEETIEGTQKRLVDTIFNDEVEELKTQLYNSLINRRLFFGGRVTANTGTDVKKVYAFNCYAAQRAIKPVDSIKGIFADAFNAAEILKTEGGIGFNFNHLRPYGTLIKGVGVGTPGVVSFMEIYDKSAEIITRGHNGKLYQSDSGDAVKRKIRKGAQMGMLSVLHPDIFDFISAKKIPNKLTKFNMSVIITDKFMFAVENDEMWDLWFPDIKFNKYDEEWNGDFEEWEEKGYPKVIYKTVKAKDLWDFIIENTYNRNEPGIYFIDNANRYNNLSYHQKVTGTNPCIDGNADIVTDKGIIKMQSLVERYQKGESFKALTCDVETNEVSWEPVVFATKTKKNANVIEIELDDGETLVLTPKHEIYVDGKGWIMSSQLEENDEILFLDEKS